MPFLLRPIADMMAARGTQILQDSHWIGSDPLTSIYGYASWSAVNATGIFLLRNPHPMYVCSQNQWHPMRISASLIMWFGIVGTYKMKNETYS